MHHASFCVSILHTQTHILRTIELLERHSEWHQQNDYCIWQFWQATFQTLPKSSLFHIIFMVRKLKLQTKLQQHCIEGKRLLSTFPYQANITHSCVRLNVPPEMKFDTKIYKFIFINSPTFALKSVHTLEWNWKWNNF